ncbi:tetratricopeptide repeat protein [Methylomicrobium sp. RS1]|uniref:tetratricopeptide repeat protein n=1 Tax=Candidatus Methylomicrobium oryzae TaxID=2802053 RepID=UPI001923B7B5|nr:tetratricopeptide repeat protein [Methylomicrobium sp. RS1]MBL1264942.1 tetratricopeptide repeat protein [Methylomicrobium sp. RS1]
MENKLSSIKSALIMAIGFLALNPLCEAAIYELEDNQKSILEPLNNESERLPSFLESINQAEKNKTKLNFEEVISLVKQNKIVEAQNKVSDLLRQYPNESQYYNLQALLYTLKKDLAKADQNFEKAIQLDSRNVLAYIGAAKFALDNGQFDKAKGYANKALGVNDRVIGAYLVLADIALKQKNINEVEKVLLTAQEKVKGDITAEIKVIQSLAKFYAIQKQPEKMLTVGNELVKRYPDDNKALSVLVGAQIINKNLPAAEATLHQIIGQDKQDIANRLLLARLLSTQSGKEKEVLKLLDEADQISPDKPEAQVFKTAYLIKLKHYQEALDLAVRVDKQSPKLVLGKLLKGDVYLAEKKLDKAIEMYRQAYKLQPSNKVLFTLADIMTIQKKQSDVINLLNNALEKDGKNGAIHFKLATVYQQQNDNKQAEAHYKAILEGQPDHVLALNNLAYLYFQQSNPKALELAKKAYEKAPESAAILDTYGYILVKQGQPKEGLLLLEKAASLASKSSDIQFHLAEAYSVNGDDQKAVEILKPLVNAEQSFLEKNAAVSLFNKLQSH